MSGRTPDLRPYVVGAGFAAGFGVLVTLWLSRGHLWAAPPSGLPGLFHYPSAYVGDSLLLPCIATLLTVGVRRIPSSRRERVLPITVSVIAGTGAAGSQALWLSDPNVRGNWTIPAPHVFNLAGWYHAFFFVCASMSLSYLAALLLVRCSSALRTSDASMVRGILRSPWTAVLFSAFFSYVALAAHDSLAPTRASRTTMIDLGLVCVALVAVSLLALRRYAVLLIPNLALGLASGAAALSIVAGSLPKGSGEILGAVGAGVVGGAVSALTLVPGRGMEDETLYRQYRPRLLHVAHMSFLLVVLLPALWLKAADAIQTGRWTAGLPWLVVYLAVLVIAPALIIRQRRREWTRQAFDVEAVVYALGLIAILGLTVPRWRQASDSAPFASFVAALAISYLFFPVLKIRMHAEIRDEQARPDVATGAVGLRGATRLSATATITMLLLVGVAGGLCLLDFTLSAAVGRYYVRDSGSLPHLPWLLAGGTALVLLTAILAWVRHLTAGASLRLLAPAMVLVWPALLVAMGLHFIGAVALFALGGGLLLGAWSLNTAINNGALLREKNIDKVFFATAICLSVSGFLSGFFAISSVLAASPLKVYTWFGGIGSAAGVLAVNAALGVVAIHLADTEGPSFTRHGLTHNLIQDGALFALLYLIALVIPATTLLHLPPSLGFWSRLIATFAVVGPFLTYFLGPYQWQLDTNLGHLSREMDSRVKPSDRIKAVALAEQSLWKRNALIVRASKGELQDGRQERFVRVLSAHIRNQNAMANAVVAVSLVALLVLLGGKTDAILAYLRKGAELNPD